MEVEEKPKYLYLCPKCLMDNRFKSAIRIRGDARAWTENDPNNSCMNCATCGTPVNDYLEYKLMGKVRYKKPNSKTDYVNIIH